MTIVVGFVPTPEGRAALNAAIGRARERDSLLVVVNSGRGDALADPHFVQGEPLDDLESLLAASGVAHEVVQPVRGRDGAQEVVDLARERRADLIVIGLRRRTAVGKLILGSNAQRILLEADCPVLAVKREDVVD